MISGINFKALLNYHKTDNATDNIISFFFQRINVGFSDVVRYPDTPDVWL